MNIVNWDESLSVGNRKIDDQHKWLISLVNKLYENINSRSEILINNTIIELYQHTLTHFDDEDNLMKEYKYHERNEHNKEHESFRKSLNTIMAKFVRKEEYITESTVAFLIDWFTDHVAKTDKKLGDHIRNSSMNRQ